MEEVGSEVGSSGKVVRVLLAVGQESLQIEWRREVERSGGREVGRVAVRCQRRVASEFGVEGFV